MSVPHQPEVRPEVRDSAHLSNARPTPNRRRPGHSGLFRGPIVRSAGDQDDTQGDCHIRRPRWRWHLSESCSRPSPPASRGRCGSSYADPVVSGNLSPASCSVAAVVVEQSAEARPASDHAERRVVVARRRRRPDDLAADRLCQWPPETDPLWPSESDPPSGGRGGDLHGESVAGSSSGSLRLRA